MFASEWFLVQVSGQNMSLQRRVFAEHPGTWRVAGADILVLYLVRGSMPPQPCHRQETFLAASKITGVVAEIRVDTFNMVAEVGSAQEVLGASIVDAFMGPFVCMATHVLCQPSWPVVGFPAAIDGAAMDLLFRNWLRE